MAWGDYIEAKQIHQQGLQNTNITITPVDILGATIVIAICILVTIGTVLAIKKARKRAVIHSQRSKEMYKHFEKKKLWRFAKVLFWLAVVAAVLFTSFHVDYYDHNDLWGLTIFILVICYPLYLLYRNVVYYIISGE